MTEPAHDPVARPASLDEWLVAVTVIKPLYDGFDLASLISAPVTTRCERLARMTDEMCVRCQANGLPYVALVTLIHLLENALVVIDLGGQKVRRVFHDAELAVRNLAVAEADHLAGKSAATTPTTISDSKAHPQAASTVEAREPHASGKSSPADGAMDTARTEGLQSAKTEVAFSAIERAVALLRRDGEHPRSTRDYAKAVGVSHTTLSRNETWRLAWKFSQELNGKSRVEMPRGAKDQNGNLEAWQDEVCENCRQEPVLRSVDIDGEAVRLCETCAEKHSRRTS